MPYKEKTVEKLYWSIGEVATDLDVNTSLIRYWEKEFGMIRPKRTGRGDRLYTRKDIELLKRIQHLVKEQGFTLQGAKDQLRKGAEVEAPVAKEEQDELRKRLLAVRERLLDLSSSC
ncbi:MAG: MerR family transcriptional regulator [Flavobacteriales bacterium]